MEQSITADRVIADYAAAVASGAPTPGGGSVVGVSGALAAGLVEMVCHLTLAGKPTPEAVEGLPSLADAAAHLRRRLLNLATEDERAYAGYRAAVAMPKSTDEEKAIRQLALQRALESAAATPLETAERSLSVLELALRAASLGTSHALSDIATAAMLANASLRGALLNVRVNARSMKNADLAERLLSESARLESAGSTLESAVLAAIAGRNA